jgi:hypothetical protein
MSATTVHTTIAGRATEMFKAFAFGAGFFIMALCIGEIGNQLIKDR